jgi:hypothetical protein
MLVPAGILVLLVLGAIAVDSAVVFLAQRDLANRTAAAANDIAAAAVNDAAFYEQGGTIELRSAPAEAFTRLAFSPDRRPHGFDGWSADVDTNGRSVTVHATAEVRLVFAPAVPGVDRTTTVEARSTAVAVGG